MNPFAKREFRWNEWNIDHIAKHGIKSWEAEHVVRNAKPPYPRRHKKGTWIVKGRLPRGQKAQVIFLIDRYEFIYVIHAMAI
ncbi:MAG TPA: hypothetical protein VGP94_14430 [Tepidisphaeraceae bacterium]|jgi:hypothetical protein|nr:hypothetical protein [Tepidisphaeraceae bacterium]